MTAPYLQIIEDAKKLQATADATNSAALDALAERLLSGEHITPESIIEQVAEFGFTPDDLQTRLAWLEDCHECRALIEQGVTAKAEGIKSTEGLQAAEKVRGWSAMPNLAAA